MDGWMDGWMDGYASISPRPCIRSLLNSPSYAPPSAVRSRPAQLSEIIYIYIYILR